MIHDLAYRGGSGDRCDNLHLGAAAGTINLVGSHGNAENELFRSSKIDGMLG
jgi:hypothetical protein